MRVTLEQFMRMTPAQQAQVTHIDLIADPLDEAKRFWRARVRAHFDVDEEREGAYR